MDPGVVVIWFIVGSVSEEVALFSGSRKVCSLLERVGFRQFVVIR